MSKRSKANRRASSTGKVALIEKIESRILLTRIDVLTTDTFTEIGNKIRDSLLGDEIVFEDGAYNLDGQLQLVRGRTYRADSPGGVTIVRQRPRHRASIPICR